MALDGCGTFCKYLLFVFNLIFALVGFAFLALGLWLRFSYNTRGFFGIHDLNSSVLLVAVTVLIVLGSVMLIVVMFGDYGACNEKRWALQVFSALLCILAGAEIVVGVLAYSRRYEVGVKMSELYNSMYLLYASAGADPGLGITLTAIHKMLHCCGVTGIKVVELIQQTCPEPDGYLEKLIMPNCPNVIANIFDSKASLVMGVFIGTGALLISALVCTGILMQQIKKISQDITAYYSSVY